MGGLRMAIAGGGRLCRTRHEPRVDRRVKRDRHPVANPAGSPAIATPSPDAGEKMGARFDGQPQALPGRAALQRGISSCWFLFARTRETAQAKKLLMKGPATLLREPIDYYNIAATMRFSEMRNLPRSSCSPVSKWIHRFATSRRKIPISRRSRN